MAEEKKAKIDLKARLGKGSVPTPSTPFVPVPPPGAAPDALSPPLGRAVGAPVGSPSGGTRSGPEASGRGALSMQRIEVDESAVHEARKGAQQYWLRVAAVVALVTAGLGYVLGGAVESSSSRAKSVSAAKSLATNAQKARDQLKVLADKIEVGRNSLLKDRKFPDSLAKDLGGVNIDFDGGQLAGVRFSGFSQETSAGLIEFISSVQATNDRKSAVASLLTKLQKPITEQLSAGQKNSINYIVLLGGPKDPGGNPFALLAPLAASIEVRDPAQLALPGEFTATNPLTKTNVNAPKYTGGALDRPVGVYVNPKSIEAACPSETVGQMAQLGGQLARVLNDIRGEAATAGDTLDAKAGLLDRADKLIANLNKVE